MITEHVTNKGVGTTKIPNKLAEEKSPYLLQHAYNPVNWYPWGEEAFTKAREEDKPIFLSIGYSTCHWCHVMAHECFEDDEVANYLNEHFISIKVDKEERPDVDSIYMSICQSVTGSGGWPLTILMTPEQAPFFAATYIPKYARYGMPGLMDLLTEVQKQWTTAKDSFYESGNQLIEIMKREYENKKTSGEVTKELAALAITQFNQSFDHDYGGFDGPPKFPTPHNLMFLLQYGYLEKDGTAQFMAERTLACMYRGGIYDHIGYGFCRYSTDEKWMVPHFEKMLYDNALLAIAYIDAYQLTKNDMYRHITEQIFDYIEREMLDKDGGFYSAQDADSEGVEGKYYLFTPEEINKIVGNEHGAYFNPYFDITKEGNFEGASLPNRLHASELEPENEKIKKLCKKVYTYRLGRTTLHKDDKILTSWNALMITAYARAAKVLQRKDYVDKAKYAVNFINTKLMDENNRLYIRYREGQAAYPGLVDDYAFYSMALLALYEATYDVEFLKQAITMTDQMLDQFWDKENGGFYLYSSNSEQLIFRPKEVYDGAIPSGNSVAGYVLQRLSAITANVKYMELADKQLRFLAGHAKSHPSSYSFSLLAILSALSPSKQIVCVAKENEDFHDLSFYLSSRFEPNTVVLVKTEENAKELEQIAEFIVDFHTINDNTTYYICENHTCKSPRNDLS